MKIFPTSLISLLLVGCLSVEAGPVQQKNERCIDPAQLQSAAEVLGKTNEEAEARFGKPREVHLSGCEFGLQKQDKVFKITGDEYVYVNATPADVLMVKTCTYSNVIIGFEMVYTVSDGSFRMFIQTIDMDGIKKLLVNQLPKEEENPEREV